MTCLTVRKAIMILNRIFFAYNTGRKKFKILTKVHDSESETILKTKLKLMKSKKLLNCTT